MRLAFHISRAARERYGVETELFTLTGNVVLPDFAASRRLALKMNELVDRDRYPERVVHAAQLNAMGLLDEILHRVVALYREQVNPRAMAQALAALRQRVGEAPLDQTLEAFAESFPTTDSLRLGQTAAAYLAGSTEGVPNREIALEELLLLWLANANPAFSPFQELFDDGLLSGTAYPAVVAGLQSYFATQPPFGPERQTLIEILRAPALAVPDSVAGQLRFIRERWGLLVEEFLDRLVISLDVLAEEEIGIWRRFHGGPGGGADTAGRTGADWLAESGWLGTGAGEAETERFSVDRDWMPRLVLLAKSTYVWLDQLSREYGRHVGRLDEIPEAELDRMASRGFTGLWLIGLWERSRASQRIKQLRGNPEAVASAYSLYDYEIAQDLGGQEAYERLRDRAWSRGVRLATDMVPNHMGVDSRWVIERPDWFISLPDPPYPAYSFNGPDLSSDGRVTIQIEDHYYDNSDAAVVFKRYDHGSGETRYVYHGNDGTSTPWNDTAQLNYLRADVRESVIQTILAVARRSPIIRFDAAMTLAKRHIERLWFPEPGHGGAIPSRAEHAMPKAEFERLMPVEFWREVVDRVAAEVPDTLLLAEAFWLMEGYFVRTLGMHRVYNSAFMHMLRDEQNAEYRTVLKTTLEFDPEILKRYVNFMTNPDERTAVDQFGKGDKYFGVATVLATLPGLPMVGHGQFDGFAEKYGMEYRRAYRDEHPDPWLVDRHEREIVPLLHRRSVFAEVADFQLYDFVTDDGSVNEDVFAYSNRSGGERSLVVYHNRYASTRGRIRDSVGAMVRIGRDGGRELGRSTVAAGLGLQDGDDVYLAMRDERSGLEFLRSSRDVHEQGLWFDLHAYDCRVFLRIRALRDSSSWPVARLAEELGGRGVPSLDEAMRNLLLRPIQEPARRLFEPERVRGARDAALIAVGPAGSPAVRALEEAIAAFGADAASLFAAIGQRSPGGALGGEQVQAASTRVAAEVRAIAGLVVGSRPAARAKAAPMDAPDPIDLLRVDSSTWLAVLAAATLRSLAAADAGAAAGPAARGWVDGLGLAAVLVEAARGMGLDEAESWRTLEGVRGLLTAPTWRAGGDGPTPAGEVVTVVSILEAWLADDAIGRFLQVNVYREVRWFNRESFQRFAAWNAILELARAGATPAGPGRARRGTEATKRSGGRVAQPGGAGGAGDVLATYRTLLELADRSGYKVEELTRIAAAAAPVVTPRSR